jgi:hypothetical protein
MADFQQNVVPTFTRLVDEDLEAIQAAKAAAKGKETGANA